MGYIYFPSCNFNIASPKTGVQLRRLLKEKMPVAGCCRLDKNEYSDEDTALILCQACRENLSAKIKTKTLWEYFDEDPEFVLPDYHGLRVSLQDCWRDREQPQVHQAVRSLLNKMNIVVSEIAENKEKSTFCGTLHFESDLLKGDEKISQLDEAVQKQLMAEQVAKHQEDIIVCYCNRCVKGITLGGGQAVHLMNLVMGQFALS